MKQFLLSFLLTSVTTSILVILLSLFFTFLRQGFQPEQNMSFGFWFC